MHCRPAPKYPAVSDGLRVSVLRRTDRRRSRAHVDIDELRKRAMANPFDPQRNRGIALTCTLAVGWLGIAPTCVTGNERVRIFAAPTSEELAAISERWPVETHTGKRTTIVRDSWVQIPESRRAVIIAHEPLGREHFGALVWPTTPAILPPVCIYVPDRSPETMLEPVDDVLDELLSRAHAIAPALAECALLIPVTRGGALLTEGLRFVATGKACDAFSGAAMDTLALLIAVDQLELAVDTQHVFVLGSGRGGTVAQLVGQRSPRIKAVASIGGPSNFHRENVLDAYGASYECAFTDDRHSSTARLDIFASSPILFASHSAPTLLMHADRDPNVPAWHSEDMHAALLRAGVTSESLTFEATNSDPPDDEVLARMALQAQISSFFAAQPPVEDPVTGGSEGGI